MELQFHSHHLVDVSSWMSRPGRWNPSSLPYHLNMPFFTFLSALERTPPTQSLKSEIWMPQTPLARYSCRGRPDWRFPCGRADDWALDFHTDFLSKIMYVRRWLVPLLSQTFSASQTSHSKLHPLCHCPSSEHPIFPRGLPDVSISSYLWSRAHSNMLPGCQSLTQAWSQAWSCHVVLWHPQDVFARGTLHFGYPRSLSVFQVHDFACDDAVIIQMSFLPLLPPAEELILKMWWIRLELRLGKNFLCIVHSWPGK